MRSVGQLLREERLKKGFTFEAVEKATKIRTKYLRAIENDEYKSMPESPYIYGFVKNYSDFLGLRTHTVMALFRRQYTKREKIKHEVIEKPLTESGWRLTPNKVMVVVVGILVILFFIYFYQQYKSLHRPPPLLVENPKEDLVTKDEQLPVFGTTDSDATITINTDPVLVKDDGKFYKDIPLTLGNNTFIIESTSRVGEKTVVIRQVTRLSVEDTSN